MPADFRQQKVDVKTHGTGDFSRDPVGIRSKRSHTNA